jgi:hypothetical protein
VREAAQASLAVTAKIRRRAAATYSRRHIDLQRVAGALCPAYGNAATRHTISLPTAS